MLSDGQTRTTRGDAQRKKYMSLNPQSNQAGSKTPVGAQGFGSSDYKSELKAIGAQLETIANQMKAKDSKSNWSKLHDIAESVECFFDEAKSPVMPASKEKTLNS